MTSRLPKGVVAAAAGAAADPERVVAAEPVGALGGGLPWRRWGAWSAAVVGGYRGGGGQWSGYHGGGGQWGGYRGGYGGGWHGGGYRGYGGWYGGWYGPGLGIYLGGPAYWGAWPYPYYGAYPAYYPYAVYGSDEPTVYVEPQQEAAPAAAYYWYYCTDPAGYYPYVQNCSKAVDDGRAAARTHCAERLGADPVIDHRQVRR